MPKKGKLIRVEEGDWKSVKIAAVELGVSIGDYLIGLHKGSAKADVPRKPKKDIPDADRFRSYSKESQLGRRAK